jgi:hypothetical protein
MAHNYDDSDDGNHPPRRGRGRGGRGNYGNRKFEQRPKKVLFSLYLHKDGDWVAPDANIYNLFKPIHLAKIARPNNPIIRYEGVINDELYWIEQSEDPRFWNFYKDGDIENMQILHYYVLPTFAIEIKNDEILV